MGSQKNGSTPNIVENVILRDIEVVALDENAQAVVLEVAKAVCSPLDKLHLAVKAFCYPIVARETPHADDGRKPCAQCAPQRSPGLMSRVGELLDPLITQLQQDIVETVRVLRSPFDRCSVEKRIMDKVLFPKIFIRDMRSPIPS